MLARAGFRDDARLSHAHRQQPLPKAIVNFVRAGVQQIFALDVNARPAQMFGQPRSKLQRSGTSGKIPQKRIKLQIESSILARLVERALEFFERRDQRFRNVAPAKRPKAPAFIRHTNCPAYSCPRVLPSA